MRTDGVDNNFAVGAKIFTHNVLDVTLPVPTNMHVTIANDVAIPAQNVFLFTTILDNDLFDFLGPPDALYLNPGQNVTMDIQNPVVSSLIFMMFKWSDQ